MKITISHRWSIKLGNCLCEANHPSSTVGRLLGLISLWTHLWCISIFCALPDQNLINNPPSLSNDRRCLLRGRRVAGVSRHESSGSECEQSPTYSEHLPNVEPESWSAVLQGGEVERERDTEGGNGGHSRRFPALRRRSVSADAPQLRAADSRWARRRAVIFVSSHTCVDVELTGARRVKFCSFLVDALVGCPGPGGEPPHFRCEA